jgi:YidC/Oxa1 family membrane protein insertase
MGSLVHTIGGIFQPILKAVAYVLTFFYSLIPNYPIDVALLTIVIMALLTPLTVKSTKSMAAMQALGPEMKKLQQKYKGAENRVQLNEEMMRLYKEHNVNPASGCLPMLLQMPAFLILYDVIRGITNTVTKGTTLETGKKCMEAVCANPRYIPEDSKMYTSIVNAKPPGALNAFGMNFAEKLLSHHSSLLVALPYLVLVLCSVGLQYLQMSRLNARNPQAAQANPQAAMMQKYMPLIFGVIYLNVAAILNVYFIVSSSIRIGTQEILFRKGIVAGPPPAAGKGSASAKVKGTGASAGERALPKAGGSGSTGKSSGAPSKSTGAKANGTKANGTRSNGEKTNGTKANGSKAGGGTAATGKSTSAKGGGTNGSSAGSKANGSKASTNGSSDDGGEDTGSSGSKSHPRSKSKRERKDW